MTPDVIVAGGELASFPTLDRDVISAVFDDDTDTWRLTTDDGETCRSRVVVAAKAPLVPWIPDLFGRRAFRGISFHAASAPADFAPAGGCIAVIGADASAGRLIDGLAGSQAELKVFPLPPRREIGRTRRIGRPLRRGHTKVITSPIDEITAAGIRSADGVHHDADVIVYGTGFSVRPGLPPDALVGTKGLTIQQAWTNGMEPYLGIAVYGFPNYFIAAQPLVIDCLQLMNGRPRIEVRRSSQQVFNEQVHLHRPRPRGLASAFDVSSIGVHDDTCDTYDGPATLTAADVCEQLRVLLCGHVDPIDGQYHWQGTVFGSLPRDLVRARTVTLTVGGRSASARITEETPQGTHSIAGVGAPPFALDDIDLTVPQP